MLKMKKRQFKYQRLARLKRATVVVETKQTASPDNTSSKAESPASETRMTCTRGTTKATITPLKLCKMTSSG